nr:immunoglobulin light chain junction region [Macaca mulatta]MOX23503.1 immunoglobulin light chain junction region [Macaca mulatta]MOX23564.1 immunoglobulin light chain junction region [Macaca mulatta]MOX23700.1 immunoglobulin light chain junction region [Macaca mulatta]MOX23707.1 immunoglobulin light chain junction region [Macaca mulatta]
CVQDTQLPPTF